MSKATTISTGLLLGLLAGAPARAAVTTADVGLESAGTSNLFLDASRESDLLLRPSLSLGVDFGDYWTAGYGGELNYFAQHPELLSQWHEAYLFANPAWGEDGDNEYTVELRAQWLSNRASYSSLDFLQAGLLNKLVLEPASWLRWQLQAEAGWRDVYNDPAASSFDLKAATVLGFTLPTRTTISAKGSFGLRRYRTPVVVTPGAVPDAADYQAEIGAHASQGLWSDAGLQLEYGFRPALGRNALLEYKLGQERFSYFGEDFLYSGHRARAVLKQLLTDRWSVEGSFGFEVRDYGGWPAMDSSGLLTGGERSDTRAMPRVLLRYGWADQSEGAGLQNAGFSLEYAYLMQRSSNAWYDTTAHLTALSVWGSW